ncbi:MAG: 4'-phosphopantetheinyl transferase superfamily protein [Pseudomonadota bacterium]
MHRSFENPLWADFASALPDVAGTAMHMAAVDDHAAALLPEEVALGASMGKSRAREFATGRMCVHMAQECLDLPISPILREHRAPVFPSAYRGAITHSTHIAAAVLSRVHRGVGLDLEIVGRVKPNLYASLFTPQEQQAWTRTSLPESLAASLAFSAKEAGYKATHTIVGEFIAFADAEIDIEADGRFSIRYIGTHSPNSVANTGRGYWSVCDDHVLTAFFID